MQNYDYTGRDNLGKLVKGTISASDEIDLANRVSRLGYFLIHATIRTAAAPSKVATPAARLSRRDVLNFTIQLATLIEAGVPLLSALRELAQDIKNKNSQRIINDLVSRVEAGSSLKDALLLHPHTFSKTYTSIVDAGEATGKLALVLDDLAKLLEWQLDLKARIKEASVYPIILFCAMIGVVTILVVKVIPMFKPMFSELGVKLPLPTRIVMTVSDIFRGYWWLLLLLAIILASIWKALSLTSRGRYLIDKFKLKIPIAGNLMYKVGLSSFCHTFAMALRSGVNVISSLGIASEVMGNKYLEQVVIKARDLVNVGEKIAVALENSADFPPLVIRMISVGEQTGSLSETLDKVNQFYDKEVPATIKRMFAIFEPAMIVLMGVVVGGIALSVFLPLIQLIGAIGG